MLLNNKRFLILFACVALLFDSFLLHANSVGTQVRVFSTRHQDAAKKAAPKKKPAAAKKKRRLLEQFHHAHLKEVSSDQRPLRGSKAMKQYELVINGQPVKSSRGNAVRYHIDHPKKFDQNPSKLYRDEPIEVCYGFIPTCNTYAGHPVPRPGKSPKFLDELQKEIISSGFRTQTSKEGGLPTVVRLEHPDGRTLFVGVDGNHRITASPHQRMLGSLTFLL